MQKNPFTEKITDAVGHPIVYVREVAEADLPDELKGTDARIYAVHDSDGNRLALTQDRGVAFALARQNDMSPLSVH